MARICEICVHPSRIDLEKRICSGCNLTELAKEYQVSYDSLYNHSQLHVTKKLSEAISKQQLNESFDLVTIIDQSLRDIRTIYTRNFEAGKDVIALKSMDSLRNMMDLLVKISYSLHQSKLLELEILQQQNVGNKKECEELVAEGLEHLTIAELKMLEKLQKKVIDQSDIIIIPDKPNKFAKIEESN